MLFFFVCFIKSWDYVLSVVGTQGSLACDPRKTQQAGVMMPPVTLPVLFRKYQSPPTQSPRSPIDANVPLVARRISRMLFENLAPSNRWDLVRKHRSGIWLRKVQVTGTTAPPKRPFYRSVSQNVSAKTLVCFFFFCFTHLFIHRHPQMIGVCGVRWSFKINCFFTKQRKENKRINTKALLVASSRDYTTESTLVFQGRSYCSLAFQQQLLQCSYYQWWVFRELERGTWFCKVD